MKKIFKKGIALILTATMLISLTACSKDEEPPVDINSGSGSISSSVESKPTSQSASKSESVTSKSESKSNSESKSESKVDNKKPAKTPTEIQTHMLTKMVEFDHKMNQEKGMKSNLAGYLYLPNTTIDDVVVQSSNNSYYLRKNKYQEENFNGCYFADFRNKFYDRNALSSNTVIYGHSMDDSKDGGMFSQLKKYIDLDFAKENQFIYFSTPTEEMVWQVFAVFYTNIDFDYIRTNPKPETYLEIINHARQGSLHNFEDVVVTTKDKILTLSTCTYKFAPKFEYPNDYRYVVMAKLLPQGAKQTPSKVVANPNPVLPGKLYN